jgi:ketosteroid isomerase-like protein
VSAEDVETIRRGIEAYNAGDVEAMIETVHPKAELRPLRSLLDGGEYRGAEGMRQLFDDYDEDWAERSIELGELRDLDGRVLVLGDFRAVGKASGVEVRYPVAWLCEMRDGAMFRLQAFSDRDTALSKLGLAP